MFQFSHTRCSLLSGAKKQGVVEPSMTPKKHNCPRRKNFCPNARISWLKHFRVWSQTNWPDLDISLWSNEKISFRSPPSSAAGSPTKWTLKKFIRSSFKYFFIRNFAFSQTILLLTFILKNCSFLSFSAAKFFMVVGVWFFASDITVFPFLDFPRFLNL